MRKLKFAFLGLITVGIIGYACKKEPVDPKLFVERYLEGRWPLRLQIETVIKNGSDTITLSDTTEFLPIDTTLFTNDLKFIRGADTVGYTIDATGENISFSAPLDSTWNIEYLRKTSFKLVYIRKETSGADVISYITERDFSK